jgi:hypothetical protein
MRRPERLIFLLALSPRRRLEDALKTLDKSNGRINQKFVDCFNDWINRWDLIELNPSNRKYTWSNNQACPILTKVDRIFVSTDWVGAFLL